MGSGAAASLAGLHQSGDLADLFGDGVGEPLAADAIVQPAERTVADLDLLDVVQAGAAVDRLDVEPGVQSFGETVLIGDVDAARARPSVTGDDRALEAVEEATVLTRHHAI